jgi:hypothetical protein
MDIGVSGFGGGGSVREGRSWQTRVSPHSSHRPLEDR